MCTYSKEPYSLCVSTPPPKQRRWTPPRRRDTEDRGTPRFHWSSVSSLRGGVHRRRASVEKKMRHRAPKIEFSIGNQDYHPKHAEHTETRVLLRKSRCSLKTRRMYRKSSFPSETEISPKTRRMHRKSSFPFEIEIFPQKPQNAPKIEFSIGNRAFHPKHTKYIENRVFHRKSRFSPKTHRMH